MISVLVYEPGRAGRLREIENTLEAMQAIVGGYIETVRLRVCGEPIVIVCNEEGRLLSLPPNRSFVGTIFVARTDGPEFASLTPADIVHVARVFDSLGL